MIQRTNSASWGNSYYFADDLAFLADSIVEAKQFIKRLEESANAKSLGLNRYEANTQYMSVNCDRDQILDQSGRFIDQVQDFVNLGCHLDSSEHTFSERKAEAACNQIKGV